MGGGVSILYADVLSHIVGSVVGCCLYFFSPTVVSVFEFIAAAVGFRPTVFSGWGVVLMYWSVRILCSIGDIY